MDQLHRSQTDKVFAGVCGGFAETYGWDPALIRIVFAAVTLLSGGFIGLILYIVAAMVMPVR